MRYLLIILSLIIFYSCDDSSKYKSHRAENGDFYNFDNDGDGRKEPVHVKGYYKKDGSYVRGHYRAKPKSRGY